MTRPPFQVQRTGMLRRVERPGQGRTFRLDSRSVSGWDEEAQQDKENTMTPNLSLEQRVTALEVAVARLQRDQPAPAADWLNRVIGSVTDLEAFDEAMRLGREYRESLRPEESEEDAP